MDNSALIAALEQARAALDSIEMEATQQRKDKKQAPPMKVEIEPAEGEAGMED